jgi:acetyl esterase/lipase
MKRLAPFAALLAIASSTVPASADDAPYSRREDVIYGRKYGTALTMDVFQPNGRRNGAAVVLVVSGGFFSSHEAINPAFARPLLDRGYTVFAVVHGSQPRYTVPEIIQDLHRAVRFVRHHAADYGVDPKRIGIAGASAGGHLSLMQGTAGDGGNPDARDPVDRESSRVQAVACFFPPTDFLNFGAPGKELIRATDHDPPFRAAFDYREPDKESRLWVPITDPERLRQITRAISPITHVSPDDPPTLILHGDRDTLVPLQQSQSMVERLKGVGVEAKLVVKEGAGHGWLGMAKDMEAFADWFDAHLKAPEGAGDDKPGRVKVTLDTSEVPGLAPWAAEAGRLVRDWHPIVAELLKSDGFTPPAEVRLVFKKDMRGVAETSGDTITIAARWIEQHPDDYGMVIHELSHVIQSYPPSRAGWLVEGIADYVRCFRYEPEAKRPPIDPRRASYRDGYKTTAGFLAWIEKHYDKQIVSKLNRALRRSEYRRELFEESTGKGLDELWSEFVESLDGRRGASRATPRRSTGVDQGFSRFMTSRTYRLPALLANSEGRGSPAMPTQILYVSPSNS